MLESRQPMGAAPPRGENMASESPPSRPEEVENSAKVAFSAAQPGASPLLASLFPSDVETEAAVRTAKAIPLARRRAPSKSASRFELGLELLRIAYSRFHCSHGAGVASGDHSRPEVP